MGRALCHEAYGNLQKEILGIVHGVMPAIGAAAAYRRMRAGFEGGGIVTRVLGHTGPRVTAVLANAPGGLQLLPSEAYGNDWLRIVAKDGKVLKSLPKNGDPYVDIYSKADVWWGLLREQWINPAGLQTSSLAQTQKHLALARKFHRDINSTYHPISYAHYGCDPKQAAFQNVTWEISADPGNALDRLAINRDDEQGELEMHEPSSPQEPDNRDPEHSKTQNSGKPLSIKAKIQDPSDPGDKTVPMHSADHQLRSGKFRGIFRQTGYEHQDSYKNKHVIAATLYSLVRIAQKMEWSKQ